MQGPEQFPMLSSQLLNITTVPTPKVGFKMLVATIQASTLRNPNGRTVKGSYQGSLAIPWKPVNKPKVLGSTSAWAKMELFGASEAQGGQGRVPLGSCMLHNRIRTNTATHIAISIYIYTYMIWYDIHVYARTYIRHVYMTHIS